MSSPPSLTKGSLVWVKLPAFPWWPAKVTDVTGSDVHVTFCGTGDLGTASRADVVPYGSRLSLRETKQKERWKKKFKHAVGEADAIHAGPVEGAAPVQAILPRARGAGTVRGRWPRRRQLYSTRRWGARPRPRTPARTRARPSKGRRRARERATSASCPLTLGCPAGARRP